MKKEWKQTKEKQESKAAAGAVCAGIVRKMTEYILAAVTIVLCIVVPLYARDGYHQIGNAKFDAYRRIMIGGFSALLALTVMYYIFRAVGHGRRIPQLSVTDQFVLAYLIMTGIATVSGGFYEDALWGMYGWNMGFLSQLSFVLLYFFLSRFGKYYRAILLGLCSTAAVVYGIGILHRLMIDPIGFYEGLTFEQKAQFLSTLGQATWYAAFLAVTLPAGIGIFLYAVSGKWRIAGGIYMTLGFCTLVTQNSDSAYFALVGMMIVFFLVSCERKETLCRFLTALTVFFASGKVMYLLVRVRPNPALEADFVTKLMWTSGLTWGLLAACLILTLLLHRSVLKGKGDAEVRKAARRIRQGTIGIAAGLAVTVILIIYMQSHGALPPEIAERVSSVSYLNWSDDWGNGRGRIWKFACKIISEESLRHRIFGIGPDCFNSYISTYHGEEAELLWGQKQLTNAHNEWLNILINGGILGAIAYIGIYVTAIGRYLRGRKQDFLLVGIAASCVSYICYNFFCYQQVLCTPFIFILMGIGEYILNRGR